MSAEFSRRSFLKYTALTAVAVAGGSLLTGCSGYAPVQHEVGTANVVLKVRSTLDWVEYDEASNTTAFRITVYNGRTNALQVDTSSFSVKADGYLAYMNSNISVTSPDAASTQIKKGETATFVVFAKNLNAYEDGPVLVTFYPDMQYSEYSSNWELDQSALVPSTEDTDETT